jgi:hypothetical protein
MVSLIAEAGKVVTNHDGLDALAWNSYRSRMGTTRGIDMCLA